MDGAPVVLWMGREDKQSNGNYCACRLSVVGGGDHDGVGVDFGDAEVAAEMNEVEGAEFAGDLDDAHVTGGAGEDGDAGDVGPGEVGARGR